LRRVHIGCSGWNYADWRERVYPKGLPARRWLEHYATLFDTVEVNSTFYRLARPGSVAQWLADTPPEFAFTVKASRFMTHIRRLQDLEAPAQRFYEGIAPLAASPKLTCVLWQLPASFRRDVPRLAEALDVTSSLPPGRHAWEFRDPGWFVPEVLELLRWHRAGLVVGHHPQRPWQPLEVTAPPAFVRFHFGAQGRRGNYSRAELEAWVPRLRALAAAADVLVYFNNDWEGFAVRNARLLRRLLAADGAKAATASAASAGTAARSRPASAVMMTGLRAAASSRAASAIAAASAAGGDEAT
jgi:uncharacterized protein YecE (DUF72 family)